MIAKFNQINNYKTEKEVGIECERVEIDLEGGQVNLYGEQVNGLLCVPFDESPTQELEQVDTVIIEPQLFVYLYDNTCIEVRDVLPSDEKPGVLICLLVDDMMEVPITDVYCITARRLPEADLPLLTAHFMSIDDARKED